MLQWHMPEEKATYILRYMLPRPPYTDETLSEKRLRELIDFCHRTNVDAVMLFVALRPYFYYICDNTEHSVAWAREYHRVARILREEGLSYQLNFQNTIGSVPYGADFSKEFNWEFIVNQYGQESTGIACPAGKRFREQMGRQLRAFAETQPDVMWIDDDFSFFNHGLTDHGPDFYCFCDEHLRRFSERSGFNITLEELLHALTQEGSPTKTRTLWLDFLRNELNDNARWVEQEIHSVSPNTRVAQMTSGSDSHAIEGRNWREYLQTLSGGLRPATRPTFGAYNETTPYQMVYSHLTLDRMLTDVRSQLPEAYDACPEIESTRFTTWSKSKAATRYQLILGQLEGCRGITLSLYDLEGSPLSEEPAYEALLTEEKSRLDSLAKLRLDAWTRHGVKLLTDPALAAKTELPEKATMRNLSGGTRTWDKVLSLLGMPVCYETPASLTKDDVVALDGATAWMPSDVELRQILSGGVLLDGEAVRILEQRGFGEWIGVSAGELSNCGTMSEVFCGELEPGIRGRMMPQRMLSNRWRILTPNHGARVDTELVEPLGTRKPGTVCYENTLGGRVCVYAGIGDLSEAFENHVRIRWLNTLLGYLSRNRFPLLNSASQRMLTLLRSHGDEMLLAFANLWTDPLTHLSCRIRKTVQEIERLAPDGAWTPLPKSAFYMDGSDTVLELDTNMQVYDFVILKMR